MTRRIHRLAAMCAGAIALVGLVAIPVLAVLAGEVAAQASPTPATPAPAPFVSGSGAPAAPAAPSAPPAVATPERPPDASAGLNIFAERCAECHGPVGRGFGSLTSELPAPPPSFADPVFMRGVTPAGAFSVVTDGRLAQRMPPWADELSAQERWDAVYGIWSFYYTPERLARGVVVWTDECAECHHDGPDAESAWPADDLLELSQRELAERSRGAGEGHDSLVGLADPTIDLALDYARARTFEPLPFDELSVDGSVSGSVTNGTDPDLGAAGAYVRLIPFAGPVPGDSITSTVDATGVYTFEEVVAGPQIAYRLVATYGGADSFHPDEIVVPTGGNVQADFEVFEPSTDEEMLVRTAHIVVSPEPEQGAVGVIEMWVIANEGQHTFVAPEGGSTLAFTLPSGATNLGVDDPALRARASVELDTLMFDAPLAPGIHEVVITYQLPYSGTELLFERAVDLPTDSLQLMAVADGAELTSEQLGPSSMTEMGGQSVVTAMGEDLAPPLVVAAAFTGLPEAAASAQAVRPLPDSAIDGRVLGALGLVLSGVGVLAALAYPAVSGRRGATGRASRLAGEYRQLVERISDLDDRHAAGSIDGEDYRDERAAVLDRAMAVRRRLDELPGVTDQ